MNPWLIGVPAAVAAGMAGITLYGGGFPRAQLFGTAVWHTPAANKLALTFDDGPNPAITPKLLELLAKHNAKATFFMVGKFVRECPSLAKEIAAQGHAIGNHTDTHPNLLFCGRRETREELQRCSEAIQQAIWATPRWFRPPFGLRSPWLIEIAQRQGMRTVLWTQLPGDWHVKPPEWLIERMKPVAAAAQENNPKSQKGAAPLPGEILCLHDGDHRRLNGDRAHTLAALAYWLPRWRDLGLEFVTMDETL
jgi:peptidoglycan/xylan/chitin deacetylase (PgdA/CDA1 family)